MKVSILIVFSFLFTPLLSGCSSIQSFLYRDYSPPPLIPKDSQGKSLEELKRVINFKKSLSNDGVISSNCSVSNQCSSKERNDVATGLIVASDNLCNEHVKTIFGNDAAYNLGFGTATNLFAGAATVASSTGAKTLFSAFALFSNAERSLINETVYKTMLSTAITSKIRETRKTARTTLINNLDTKTIAQYSFDRAVQDVVDYHTNCSFMNGLELALKEGTQDNTASKQATLRQSLKLASIEYDSRIRELNAANPKATPAALADILKGDPQLIGLTNRINSLNESLKKLETLESN